MIITYFFLILFAALLISLFYYLILFKTKKKPKIETLYTSALNAMVKGDSLKAVSILKQVVKQDSDHIGAYLQLGNILRENNPNKAIKIHKSLTIRPNLHSEIQLDIHRALAVDYEFIGNYTQAIKEAEKVLSIEKRNLWALNFLVKISEKNQNWDKAASWTKQLHKVSGKKHTDNQAKFDVYRGLECLKNEQLEEAKSFFQKAIKIAPEFGLGYRYLGDVFEKTRDLVKALENWEKFAEKDIKNGYSVYPKIESALFDLGRYSEVEKFYRRILELNPSNFEAIIRLANVLEEKGESSSAYKLIDNAILNNNDDVRVDLMKLKLSLSTSTPVELSHQVDMILDKLSNI